VDGLIYSNVWQTECIAQIDPTTGNVVSWSLMQGLRALADNAKPLGAPTPDVLNGIAYNAQDNQLFVTGKLWSQLYQVNLVPVDPTNAPPGVPTTLSAARTACTPPT